MVFALRETRRILEQHELPFDRFVLFQVKALVVLVVHQQLDLSIQVVLVAVHTGLQLVQIVEQHLELALLRLEIGVQNLLDFVEALDLAVNLLDQLDRLLAGRVLEDDLRVIVVDQLVLLHQLRVLEQALQLLDLDVGLFDGVLDLERQFVVVVHLQLVHLLYHDRLVQRVLALAGQRHHFLVVQRLLLVVHRLLLLVALVDRRAPLVAPLDEVLQEQIDSLIIAYAVAVDQQFLLDDFVIHSRFARWQLLLSEAVDGSRCGRNGSFGTDS